VESSPLEARMEGGLRPAVGGCGCVTPRLV
jgi:hypothetical protein